MAVNRECHGFLCNNIVSINMVNTLFNIRSIHYLLIIPLTK